MIRKRYITGILLLALIWYLGWVSNQFFSARDKLQPRQEATTDTTTVYITELPERRTNSARSILVNISRLLKEGLYESVIHQYLSLQEQGGARQQNRARQLILRYAQQLQQQGEHSNAVRLLELFTEQEFRDVAALALLGKSYLTLDRYEAAVEKLYIAKGYAASSEQLQRITAAIRQTVKDSVKDLQENKDVSRQIKLYQMLTQLEPDYAEYFLHLALVYIQVENVNAARQALNLIIYDPVLGNDAQRLLAKLDESTRVASNDSAPQETPESEFVATEIPLIRYGNHFIVEALSAENKTLRLMIDTGASLTTIKPSVLKHHGIKFIDIDKGAVFVTAGGRVRAPIFDMKALIIGDYQVAPIRVVGIELLGDDQIDGLLGMNFLSRFHFFIDQEKAVLRLSE